MKLRVGRARLDMSQSGCCAISLLTLSYDSEEAVENVVAPVILLFTQSLLLGLVLLAGIAPFLIDLMDAVSQRAERIRVICKVGCGGGRVRHLQHRSHLG